MNPKKKCSMHLKGKKDFSALSSLSCLLKNGVLTSIIMRRKENEKTEDLGNTRNKQGERPAK